MPGLSSPLPPKRVDWFFLPIALAVAVFPCTVLTAPRIANLSFSCLAAVGLILILRGAIARSPQLSETLRIGWPLVISTAALPLAVAFSQIVTEGRAPDVPYLYLRFALFLPLVWVLLPRVERIRPLLEYGLIGGALASGVWLMSLDPVIRPGWIGESSVIPFANLSLLMGMLAFASTATEAPARGWVIAARTLALMAGIYVSIASETRGGWIAIPLLLLVIGYAANHSGHRLLPRLLLLSSIGLALAITASSRLRVRVSDAVDGLLQRNTAESGENAVSVRLELWKAAMEIFLSNPVAGIGPSGMESALKALERDGSISALSATYTHAHNDVLHALATLGLPGGLAGAACTLVPAWFFAKRMRHPDRALRSAATLGLITSLGMLLFGLTEAMLVISLTNAFHCLMLSAFFAMIVARERAL